MRMLGNSISGITPHYKRLLYVTVILPVLTYGAHLWFRHESKRCKTLVNKLSKVQHAAARWITGGFSTSPSGALETIAGLPPFRLNLEMSYAKASLRLRRAHDNQGLTHWALPPLHWDTPSLGSLIRANGRTIILPPFRTRRNVADPGPQISLLRRTETAIEPSPHILPHSPGTRALDLYEDCITIFPPFPKPAPHLLSEWAPLLAQKLTELFDHNTFFVAASAPRDLRTQSGAWGHLNNPANPGFTCEAMDATNHHELTLAALVDITRFLPTIRGHVKLFIRNQAAIFTILDTSYKHNRHYARKFNDALLAWLGSHPSNRITLFHLPHLVDPRPWEDLVMRCKQAKKRRHFDFDSLSPASFLHELKKDLNNERDTTTLRPHYIGSNFLRLQVDGRRIQHKHGSRNTYIQAADNSNRRLAQLTRAITAHAPIGEYYKRFLPHLGSACPAHPLDEESRAHVFTHHPTPDDHANDEHVGEEPLTAYWESWFQWIQGDKDSLSTLATYLSHNPGLFSTFRR